MKGPKLYIIITLVIFTSCVLLYLVFVSKQIERYAISHVEGRDCYILYSSGESGMDEIASRDVLGYCQTVLKNAGYEVINLGVVKQGGDIDYRNLIQNSMKDRKKNIVIDIGVDNYVALKNRVLIRLGSNNNPKYQNNLEFAEKIKSGIEGKGIGVNIYCVTRGNLNQDIGDLSMKLDISRANSGEERKNIASAILEALLK